MALTHTDETGESLKTIQKALGKWEEVLTVLQSLHHILHPPFYTHHGHPLRIVSSGRIREQKYAPVTYIIVIIIGVTYRMAVMDCHTLYSSTTMVHAVAAENRINAHDIGDLDCRSASALPVISHG
jgi:hypothetical protein